MTGTLFLVATPIGNLGDMTFRAVDTLKSADFIAAEDTRVTRKLLAHFAIATPLISYHQHNERDAGENIIARILAGESCALVSDAGTPAISDPGERLVRAAAEAGIPVLPVPGASACIAAVSVSGLPVGRFTFEGFLPMNRRARKEHLASLLSERRTMVFYEAPHKLVRTLRDLLDAFGDRDIAISRELTKVFEETRRETISGALSHFEATPPKGEFVLVLAGAPEPAREEPDEERALALALRLVAEGQSVKDAAKEAALRAGVPRKDVYAALLAAREAEGD